MAMQRFQMMLGDERDDELARRAAQEGVSKAGSLRSRGRAEQPPVSFVDIFLFAWQVATDVNHAAVRRT